MNLFYKFFNKLCFYAPLIYANFISKSKILLYTTNTFFICNFFYNNPDYLEKIIDETLKIKIFIDNFFSKKSNFELNKVLLYIDLDNNLDVTEYFKKNINKIKKLDYNLLYELYNYKKIIYNSDQNIRLKIFYSYEKKEYIQYFYNGILPYPIYSEDIINNYRNDIVYNKYNKDIRKKYFYSLFSMDSKDIDIVKINNVENNILLEYMKMLQTPFNDFGILYDNPIKLLWIISENNIEDKDFKEFYLKYKNFYLDEDKLELKEHEIKLDDLNSFIISDRMKNILKEKNLNDINN